MINQWIAGHQRRFLNAILVKNITTLLLMTVNAQNYMYVYIYITTFYNCKTTTGWKKTPLPIPTLMFYKTLSRPTSEAMVGSWTTLLALSMWHWPWNTLFGKVEGSRSLLEMLRSGVRHYCWPGIQWDLYQLDNPRTNPLTPNHL